MLSIACSETVLSYIRGNGVQKMNSAIATVLGYLTFNNVIPTVNEGIIISAYV